MKRMMPTKPPRLLPFLALLILGCGSGAGHSGDAGVDPVPDVTQTDMPASDAPTDPGAPAEDTASDAPTEDNAPEDAGSDVFDPADGEPEFTPWMVRRSPAIDPVRGWVVRQGHLHAHSVFSHDACDNQPRVNGETGARNEACFHDLRNGICQAGLDFLFLTDHMAMFPEYEFPEVLLYEPSAGDALVMREDLPVANRIPCPDGPSALVAAGLDRHWLAVGLERHAGDTVEARKANYQNADTETFARLREHGALITTAYSSEWKEDEILAHEWDGYEIYNPATNLREKLMEIATALGMMSEDPASVPVPELAILAAFEEGAVNLRYWSLLAQARPVFSFIGPNAHRNTFAMELDDGERLDSYRRIFRWYGNFLLIPGDRADDADDRTYVATMAAGRMYSAFLFYGYPVGFDFHALVGPDVHEMGARLPDAADVTFQVHVPRLYGRRAPGTDAPEITAHLLRATPDGGWESLASGSTDFTFAPTGPGVYRVDVRIVPRHLVPWLGRTPEAYLAERSWVVSNPIYVGMTTPPAR